MQTSRRIYFNPTSIPSLRTPRPPRRDFYNAGKIPRVGLRNGTGKWRGIRKESTDTGENQTGHISATSNEAILFFDSEVYAEFLHLLNSHSPRYFPFKAHLASTIAMASRTKSSRPPLAVQQPDSWCFRTFNSCEARNS